MERSRLARKLINRVGARFERNPALHRGAAIVERGADVSVNCRHSDVEYNLLLRKYFDIGY